MQLVCSLYDVVERDHDNETMLPLMLNNLKNLCFVSDSWQ